MGTTRAADIGGQALFARYLLQLCQVFSSRTLSTRNYVWRLKLSGDLMWNRHQPQWLLVVCITL